MQVNSSNWAEFSQHVIEICDDYEKDLWPAYEEALAAWEKNQPAPAALRLLQVSLLQLQFFKGRIAQEKDAAKLINAFNAYMGDDQSNKEKEDKFFESLLNSAASGKRSFQIKCE